MKKWMSTVGLFLCAVLLFTGCAKAPAKEVDVQAAADYFAANIAFDDEISSVARKQLGNRYGIEDSVEAAAYIGSSATPEEVLVLKAADEAGAKKLMDTMKVHLQELKSAFRSYRPEEAPKVDKAVLLRSGKAVIVVVSADEKALQTVKSYVGQ